MANCNQSTKNKVRDANGMKEEAIEQTQAIRISIAMVIQRRIWCFSFQINTRHRFKKHETFQVDLFHSSFTSFMFMCVRGFVFFYVIGFNFSTFLIGKMKERLFCLVIFCSLEINSIVGKCPRSCL